MKLSVSKCLFDDRWEKMYSHYKRFRNNFIRRVNFSEILAAAHVSNLTFTVTVTCVQEPLPPRSRHESFARTPSPLTASWFRNFVSRGSATSARILRIMDRVSCARLATWYFSSVIQWRIVCDAITTMIYRVLPRVSRQVVNKIQRSVLKRRRGAAAAVCRFYSSV